MKQTELVVQYLSIARLHEHSTRLEIPKIKHAPTSLAASLEEYLHDRDFETNRRQYLAEREAKKNGGKPINGVSKSTADAKPAATTTAASTDRPSLHKSHPSAPLIDFFSSIGDNQQTMGQPQVQQYPQQTGFQQTGFEQPGMQIPQQTAMGFPQQQQQQAFSPVTGQGTNPFGQMQPPQQMQLSQQPELQTQFTGAGFGGYTPQPFSPQNSSLASIPQNGIPDFSSQPQQQQLPTIAEPLQQQQTSTNPFRQSTLPSVAEQKLISNPTGMASPGLGRSPTNPFAKHTTGFQAQPPMPTGMSFSPFAPIPSIQVPQSSSPFAPQLDQSSPFAPQVNQSSPFAPQQPQSSPFAPQQQQPLMPSPTGTNPFARGPSPQNNGSPGGLSVHATGSTNPFRQSAFVNQQTGQGWQNSTGQGTLGGMDLNQVPTQSVFPRPGQQPQQQTGFMG